MNQTIGADKSGNKEALDILLTNQQHIHENIKFADQKALVFIGLDTALIAFVFNIAQGSGFEWYWVGLAVCFLLLAGLFFGLLVVKPRSNRGSRRGTGLIDANRICQYADDEKYRKECEEATVQRLIEETRTFIYDRSTIDRDKYRYLGRAIWVSAAGGVCALAFAAYFGRHLKPSEVAKTPEHAQSAVAASGVPDFVLHPSSAKEPKGAAFLLNQKTGDVWQLEYRNGSAVLASVPTEQKMRSLPR